MIEDKVGNLLKLIGTGENFLNNTSVALKPTFNKQDLMMLKHFCKTKDTTNLLKSKLLSRKNIYASDKVM